VSWKHNAPDQMIEIVVDPSFVGDILDLARHRPIWIVDTAENRPKIDDAWLVGRDMELFEVSRASVRHPSDRETSLMDILGVLDDHYGEYDFIVHGLAPDDDLRLKLREEGFDIDRETLDGFVATRIPGVRQTLIGRGPIARS
jgi:hypothetical protein